MASNQIINIVNSNLSLNSLNNNNGNNSNNIHEENIGCFIRCKPLSLNEKEMKLNCIEIGVNKSNIIVKNYDSVFTYEKIYDEDTTQENIFNDIGLPILKNFLSGYNATIFAYGQTGSGKTYTMIGPMDNLFKGKNEKYGLIPNILNFLFDNKEETMSIIKNSIEEKNIKNIKYNLSCSCIEIYQEHIIDLLSNNVNEDDEILKIREDPKKGMYIDNLTEINIDNDKSAKEALILGFKNRHVGSTNMNRESSRSHLIYTLFLESIFDLSNGLIITRNSRLHLVDLAGSERQKSTNSKGERIKEAGNINKSLSTLGNVINSVIEYNEGKKKFVPFRDSKLTYYLKDSLGGNSKTVIIGNISQSSIQVNETLGTLNFIQRAKMIKNKTKIIENVNDVMKLIQNENNTLKISNNELKENNLKLKNELNEKIKLIEILNTNISHLKNANSLLTNPIKKLLKPIKKEPKSVMINKIPVQEIILSFKGNKKITNNDCKINSINTNINNNITNQNNAIITTSNNNIVINTNSNTIINTMNTQTLINYADLNELISNTNKIINMEKEINENLNILGTINLTEFQNFMVKKEIYEAEIKNLIDYIITDGKNSIKFLDEKDENNKYINDLYNKLYKDKTKIFSLEQENKKLTQENEVYKSITNYFIKESNTKEQKENINSNKIEKLINKFIDTNNELINFFNKNLDTNKEYYIASKEYINKINAEIKDLKTENEKTNKKLEILENDNFLLNMELTKYKDNSTDILIKKNEINKNKENMSIINEVYFLSENIDVLLNEMNNIFTSEINQHKEDLKYQKNVLNNFIQEIYKIFNCNNDKEININECLNTLIEINQSTEIYKLINESNNSSSI